MNRYLLFFTLFGLSGAAFSETKSTILWGVGNTPPRLTIDKHGNLGGQGGKQQLLLEEGLKTEYLHKHVPMTWARFEAEIEKGSQVCSSFVFKTGYREKYGVFSLPWHIDLAHQIIIRKSTYSQLGEPDSISLKELIGNDALDGGVELGRSYSNLDAILVSPKDSTNIMTIPTLPGRILSMLNAGRIDYIIEYPYVASHTQKELGLDPAAIVSIPIEEINPYAFTRVGCPNTKWGNEVIAKTNTFISKIRAKKSYLDVLKMIHIDPKDRELVEQVYYEHFVNATE